MIHTLSRIQAHLGKSTKSFHENIFTKGCSVELVYGSWLQLSCFNLQSKPHCLHKLLSLIPKALLPWFGPKVTRTVQTEKIKAEDMEHFNQMMGMIFFGAAQHYLHLLKSVKYTNKTHGLVILHAMDF